MFGKDTLSHIQREREGEWEGWREEKREEEVKMKLHYNMATMFLLEATH